MKKVKIGFLAVVAVLALGFTASEKMNVLDNTKKVTAIPACFRQITAASASCNGSQTDYIESSNACPGEPNGLLNKKIWGANAGLSYVFTGVKPPDCSVGNTFFCCVTVTVDPSPCTGQPQFDLDGDKDLEYYKIVNTYCRP